MTKFNYILNVRRKVVLKPRLHLPRSSYDFSVCDFLYDFKTSWATTYVLTIHTGIVRFFDLPFVDVFIQKRKAIVRQSYVSADST